MNYKTARWKKKREAILKRDKYTCQYYKRFGRIVEADTVHHIFPVEHYPELEYCSWNLISLSSKAHNLMHERGGHELTKEGRELQRKAGKYFKKYKEETPAP